MDAQTKKALESAICTLSGKITGEVKSDDALKYTQAALNAAHVIAVMSQTDKA